MTVGSIAFKSVFIQETSTEQTDNEKAVGGKNTGDQRTVDDDSGGDDDIDSEDNDDDDDAEDNSVDGSDVNDKEEEEDDESDAEDSNDEEDSDNDDSEIERQISKAARKQSHDAKEGRTVFIRNLPFETEEDELIELFSKFGPVDDCKLVVDKETGHSRGTAFVKFKDVSSTDAAVSASEDTDSKEEGIKFNGRRLFIVKAVTRGKVKEIEKEKKDAKKEPKDKRNIALATEGVIFPNSEAAKELSEADMKKREKAWAEKKAKLKKSKLFRLKNQVSCQCSFFKIIYLSLFVG